LHHFKHTILTTFLLKYHHIFTIFSFYLFIIISIILLFLRYFYMIQTYRYYLNDSILKTYVRTCTVRATNWIVYKTKQNIRWILKEHFIRRMLAKLQFACPFSLHFFNSIIPLARQGYRVLDSLYLWALGCDIVLDSRGIKRTKKLSCVLL
jgi:hypothetical protein